MGRNKLLIVSLDALSQSDLELLKQGPFIRKFIGDGFLIDDVSPIFVSNTYPIHTSVITGTNPDKHGIYDNVIPNPNDPNPSWFWYSKDIQVPTLYDKARSNGLIAASILWPVTAGAKIKYNIPEILPTKPYENQAFLSLAFGNPLLTLKTVFKYIKKLRGVSQPGLDDVSCLTMCDLIKVKNPDLMLIHFTDADTNKHAYGVDSLEARNAVLRMDNRIGILMEALASVNSPEDYHVIIFSDHGMTNVEKSINPNFIFDDAGLIEYDNSGKIKRWKAWLKCCGGSCFCYLNYKNKSIKDFEKLEEKVRNIVEQGFKSPTTGLNGYLGKDEFIQSGFRRDCIFGLSAKLNCELLNNVKHSHKANHGYSVIGGAYNTFYMGFGPRFKSNFRSSGGNLLEIAPLACKILDISPWEMDGKLRTEILK